MDSFQQVLLVEWFCQEVNCSRLDRAHRGRNIAVSRNKYNWWMIPIGNPALQIQAVDARKFHVQNETSRQIGLRKLDILSSGSERDNPHIQGRKKFKQRFADARVIIHYKNNMVLRVHAGSAARMGRVKLNVAHSVSLVVADRRPSCASAIERQIARPMPIPFSFVVKNGSTASSR